MLYEIACRFNDGAVKCWGANANGQLGDETTGASPLPVDVSGLTGGVKAIAAGASHTCAVTSSGAVKCWGYNDHGQLGDNSTSQRLAPVAVSGLTSGAALVAAGSAHSCVITQSGRKAVVPDCLLSARSLPC